MPLQVDCPISPEVLAGLNELSDGIVNSIYLVDGSADYQLQRFNKTGELIRRTVLKRIGRMSRRLTGDHDFPKIVNNLFGDLPEDGRERKIEEQAREEKASALEEIFKSRFSVLIGAAGTGKTTLLKMICELNDVAAGGVLLLAPTGKARVQLESKTDQTGGFTIARR